MKWAWIFATVLAAACLVPSLTRGAFAEEEKGILPTDDDGRPLNTDFETGTLKDWTATGNAFAQQPIKGDAIEARHAGHSNHAGNYWIGTYEIAQDGPRGILTSATFKVTHPWAKFLIGGGSIDETVEIVLADGEKVFFTTSGDNSEDMQPVAVDLRPILGQKIFIRVHDDHSFSWGHINFDDFKFYDAEPKVPKRTFSPDAVKFAGLSPQEAVKAITLPEGFKATLFAGEPDVYQPVGFCFDDRGRLWVAEAYTYPVRAPEGQGKDDIIIFEDTDGDGHFDKRTVFTTGLNLVSGIEIGFGGVWVGAAPYLMFIPDRDHDDKPDGPPEILLDGFAYQDTHETLNAFNWGPDGWLYGCHGVFTHSRVGKPGTSDEQRIPINAGIWRYHPTKKVFEVFAEGTSNPWGIDFNDYGQAFCTACVIPHLYHVIQGAHYQRQAGSHFNPHVYRDIQNIADHVHWVGDKGPHAANSSSASAGGGHAHCGAMLYEGGLWPDKYRDTIFMSNIHGNRVNDDILEQIGSGYVGHHGPDPVLMNDKWSRIINLKYGPDGNVFMIDWYDRNACHNPLSEVWDRTNGRIYKISYSSSPSPGTPGEGRGEGPFDLQKLSNDELVQLQINKNDWYVRHARRILQERQAGTDVVQALCKLYHEHAEPTIKLRMMWAAFCISGELPGAMTAFKADYENQYVRAWMVQLIAESWELQSNLTGPFKSGSDVQETPSSFPQPTTRAGMGDAIFASLPFDDDPSPVVRLALASALQQRSPAGRWPILKKLVAHSEDATDHNLPLMYWYAAEPAVAADIERGLELAKRAKITPLREFITRRIASVAIAGGDKSPVDIKPLAGLARLLLETLEPSQQLEILTGMSDALASRRSVTPPPQWAAVYDQLGQSANDDTRLRVQSLSVIFGDERALAALRKIITDRSAPVADRTKAIDALLGAADAKLPPLLLNLLDDPPLRGLALRGLASFDSPETPPAILKIYPQLDQATKVDALNTLASRVPYAMQLKSAVESGAIAKSDISAATLRQLYSLEDETLRNWIAQNFGTVRSTPEAKLKEIATFKSLLTPTAMKRADPSAGRAVFARVCMQCHTLFAVGGKVGPDLTGSNRADPDYVLSNVVDPSAVIGKDYLASLIHLKDNRVLSGIVKSEDDNAITLVTENQTLVIPKNEITSRKLSNLSMMPEGLLAGLKHDDIRDLIAYLKSSTQVPMLATAENAASFFNGKDLNNWSADIDAWRVETGEIVGKTAGLTENHFLQSQLTVADFRLTLKVKLINNAGNSGIQFRSEPFGKTEMKGYQADVGPGWWGKLYEENGRQILSSNGGEKFVNANDWNTYEIVAVGTHILTALNGHKCVDIDDPKGERRGIIALQLHAGGPTEVRFKDLKLEIDPKPELMTAK